MYLRKQILGGHYVNLASLLVSSFDHFDDPNNGLRNSASHDATSLTFAEFVLAFGKYSEIICEHNELRRGELQRYLADITQMYNQFGGTLFYQYHQQFAARAASLLNHYNTKVDWSIRDQNIYASLAAKQRSHSCNAYPSGNIHGSSCPTYSASQPSRLERVLDRASPFYRRDRFHQDKRSNTTDIRGRARQLHKGKEICNNFNEKAGCTRNICPFYHVCLWCHGSHSRIKCPDRHTTASRSTEPGGRGARLCKFDIKDAFKQIPVHPYP